MKPRDAENLVAWVQGLIDSASSDPKRGIVEVVSAILLSLKHDDPEGLVPIALRLVYVRYGSPEVVDVLESFVEDKPSDDFLTRAEVFQALRKALRDPASWRSWRGSHSEQCDACGARFGNVFYDAKTRGGPWGLLCSDCMDAIGSKELGTGLGQAYDRVTKLKIGG